MSELVTPLAIGATGLLFGGLAFSAWRQGERETWKRRSNARIVREVKRIARHEPEKITEVIDQERT